VSGSARADRDGGTAVDPLDALRADPAAAAVLTDFDGTLSELVDDPAAAAAAPGAVDALVDLAGRYALVGVVSGRPVAFLRHRLDERLWLSGLYGLEELDGGREGEHAVGRTWRPVVEAATARATGRFGPLAEGKGLSLTLHHRTRPDLAGAVEAWARDEAAASGLLLRAAKASVELHPPVELDKGTAIEDAVERRRLRTVLFMGDDLGDLTAFDALDRLAGRGVTGIRVAATTADTPDELVVRADLVVDGPAGAVALLRSL